MDEEDEPFVPENEDDDGDEDEDYKLAVHDSLRTEMEEQARREELELNKKENEAVDEWLHAVAGVPDPGEASVKKEKSSPAGEGKGKKPIFDVSDDDTV